MTVLILSLYIDITVKYHACIFSFFRHAFDSLCMEKCRMTKCALPLDAWINRSRYIHSFRYNDLKRGNNMGIYYIPGCDVRRNHPIAVHKMETWMSEHGILPAACCRKDLSFLKGNDMIVENCTLCELMLKERIPNIPFVSLYEYLDENGFEWPDWHGKVLSLQDCRRTVNNTSLQNAVRSVLLKMNISIVETSENREKSRYCGVWYNNPPAPDCVELAPKTFVQLETERILLTAEEQKAKMTEWVEQYETEEIAVYCNGCEKGIRLGGGKPLHLIELITRDL